MKSNYLLPHKFKLIGWIIFIPAVILGLITFSFGIEPEFLDVKVFSLYEAQFLSESSFIGFIENNIVDELLSILIIISSMFIALSKEKHEDELILKMRLESLLWATYLNYGILLLAIILIYGIPFLMVMDIHIVSLLIFFALRFKWVIYKSNRRLAYEE